MRIHIIENNITFNHLLKKILEKGGFKVTQAFSIHSDIPESDLYITDLWLEEVSFENINKIRKKSKAPIIVISGFDVDEYKKQAMKVGATLYIDKLTPSDEILKIINNYVTIRSN